MAETDSAKDANEKNHSIRSLKSDPDDTHISGVKSEEKAENELEEQDPLHPQDKSSFCSEPQGFGETTQCVSNFENETRYESEHPSIVICTEILTENQNDINLDVGVSDELDHSTIHLNKKEVEWELNLDCSDVDKKLTYPDATTKTSSGTDDKSLNELERCNLKLDKGSPDESDKFSSVLGTEYPALSDLPNSSTDIPYSRLEEEASVRSKPYYLTSKAVSETNNLNPEFGAEISSKLYQNSSTSKSEPLEVPTDSMSALPRKDLDEGDEKPSPWCDLCYDDSSEVVRADGFCSDCNSFVCETCLTAHKKSPASKLHKIFQDARMPKSQSDKPIRFHTCVTHSGNVKSKFCLHHGTMACTECIKTTHHDCKTASIYTVCKEIGREDVIELKDTVESILKTTTRAKAGVEKNFTNLDKQRKEMSREVQSLHDQMIAKVKELCHAKNIEINEVCERKKTRFSDQILVLSDIIDSFQVSISNIEKVIDSNIDTNSFIRIQDIVETIRLARIEIKNIHEDLNKIELSFSLNPDISSFLTTCKGVGHIDDEAQEIEETSKLIPEIVFPKPLKVRNATVLQAEKTQSADQLETESTDQETTAANALQLEKSQSTDQFETKCSNQENIPTSNSSRSNIERRAKQKKYRIKKARLNTTLSEDEQKCEISEMDVTNDGMLIITDNKNYSVKIFSTDNQLLTSVLFTELPQGVIVINDVTAVVSTFHGELFILDISDPKSAFVQKSIYLGYWVRSMTVCNDSLVVIKSTDPKSVNMIDLEGNELWSVSVDRDGQNLFEKPYAITTSVMCDKPTILVTDWGKDKMIVLDAMDGDIIKIMDVKDKGPHGITADCDGNVYICYFRGRELCVLSSDLTQSKIVMSGKELPSYPRNIAFNDNLNELFINYNKEDWVGRIALPDIE